MAPVVIITAHERFVRQQRLFLRAPGRAVRCKSSSLSMPGTDATYIGILCIKFHQASAAAVGFWLPFLAQHTTV